MRIHHLAHTCTITIELLDDRSSSWREIKLKVYLDTFTVALGELHWNTRLDTLKNWHGVATHTIQQELGIGPFLRCIRFAQKTVPLGLKKWNCTSAVWSNTSGLCIGKRCTNSTALECKAEYKTSDLAVSHAHLKLRDPRPASMQVKKWKCLKVQTLWVQISSEQSTCDIHTLTAAWKQ